MIGGEVKVSSNKSTFVKKCGIFEASVVKFNPDVEWYADNGMELSEGSRATEYLGEDKEGKATCRISCWVKEVNNGQLFQVNFFLKDKEAIKSDGTKKQYINDQGVTTWAEEEEKLPSWFAGRDYRVAKEGEEELYNFLRTWLDDINFKKDGTLKLDFKKLMQGDLREINEQIGGKYACNIVLPAIIKTVDTQSGVTKEYQGVFNKAVTKGYNMKYFQVKKFTDEYLEQIRNKKPKDRKAFEKFAVILTDEKYGCKDFYSLEPLHDYNPKDNPVSVATTTTVSATDDSY